MGGTSTRWCITLVMLLATATGQLLLSTPTQARTERTAQVAGNLALSDRTVAPAERVTVTGKLPPRRARTVRLQTLRNGSWTVVATEKSSRRGTFRFSTTGPTRAGDRDYRVLAPAATLGGRRYGAVVTPTRTLTVVTMVATAGGWRHSCALGSDRRAWCWGSNESGELGIGDAWTDAGSISRPTQVVGRGWTDLSAAGASTCGLRADDSAWCWGDAAGHLVTDGSYRAPVKLAGEWSQLSAGAFYFCGVHTDTQGWCQGQNEDGQLGTAASVPANTPVQVPGSWLSIVAGEGFEDVTTCGIKADRSAWCWGQGGEGQLGNGSASSSPTPVEVAGDHEWASLSVGGTHVCGVDTAHVGWCWGDNTDDRLGDGTALIERHQPVRVVAAQTWSTLDAGFMHTCGTTPDHEGLCFGWNAHGQLGNGTTETRYFSEDPFTYDPLPGSWSLIAAGFHSSVALRPPGLVSAWGEAVHGQTGQGAAGLATRPVAVVIDP